MVLTISHTRPETVKTVPNSGAAISPTVETVGCVGVCEETGVLISLQLNV